ncbi:universal stress protein [Natrinema thermotolerans]|uniref:Universal stress protein n=1 Tax=Natrinema thermotolerans TaxID=121872 RepID=A0AAF0PC33_9EURY|nr:universal stress protein [Natrinema thermotolerans]QCC59380.1 universal stress protein [Natrinema thermotolerans]WMT06350.1 universal stress protein [Natrinema thermotolerans]
MVDGSERTAVRITVPRQSVDSDVDSSLRSGPLIRTPEYTVVVPVTDVLLDTETRSNVRRLLRTAVALAADNDGRVLLLGLETVPNDASLETVRRYLRRERSADSDAEVPETVEKRRKHVARIAERARDLEPSVPIRPVVRVVSDATDGIRAVIDDGSETAVLLLRDTGFGADGRRSVGRIDSNLADAECDVFVETPSVRGEETPLYVPDVEDHTVASLAEAEATPIDSILLPVGGGPHAALAAEAARALARAVDASVTVLHVIPPDAPAQTAAEGTELLKFAEYVLGSDVTSEVELREAPETADEIVREAKTHDLTSIGAPEQRSRLEQLVFESVQQTLSELHGTTVLVARDADRTTRSLYYRWKRGIEASGDERESVN